MDTSRRPWVPLIAVALGYFMVILDATAVNLALPAISRELGGGVTGLQWVVDGYTLAWVDRRVDRRRPGVTDPRPASAAGTRPVAAARRPG